MLTLFKGTQKIGEYPPVYLDFKETKEMYEQWTVSPSVNGTPQPASSGVDSTVLTAHSATRLRALPDPQTDEERDYILLVHGWNVTEVSAKAFADTAFKRLWHQGYRGQFGSFRWPALYVADPGSSNPLTEILGYGFTAADINNFDSSEKNAWLSGEGLLDCVKALNQKHGGSSASRVRVLAHIQGNIVAGEALRQAGHTNVLHTYIASQGAVTADCYFRGAVDMQSRLALNLGYQNTPDVYSYAWKTGAPVLAADWTSAQPSYFAPEYMSSAAGKYVNFYNPYDYGLNGIVWQLDQQLKAEDGFSYVWPDGFIKYEGPFPQHRILAFPNDRFEVMAFAAEARAYAIGMYGDTRGVFLEENVFNIQSYFGKSRPQDDYSEHKYHSGEFRGTNMQRWKYWKAVLDKSDI